LPDFRGRVPIHWGQGPGLSTYQVGDRGGTESTTLSVVNMPAHNHLVNVDNTAGGQHVPANHLPGVTPPNALAKPYSLGAANATMNPQMIAMAGASQPFSNLQPYLAVSFIIALIGIFPARS
jgi:microcystin-dependent protein